MAKAKAKKAPKVKNVEEDTNRTEAVSTEVAQAGRDDEENLDAGSAPEVVASDEVQLDESVVIEDPTPAAEPIDFEDMDDPRLQIAAKHDEKHRDFSEKGESGLETDESTDIISGNDGDPEMVEVKVSGEIRQVEKAKVDKAGGVQAYQKQQAADAGMRENARQRDTLDDRARTLDARERLIAGKEAALPTLGAQPKGQSPADLPLPGDQTIETLARQYQEAVYDGEENAPELLAQLVQTAKDQNTPIDETAMITRAADELERRTRRKQVTTATKVLIDAHPELNKESSEFDGRLWTAIDDETTVVERQNPDWEPQDVLNEAYTRISKWKGSHKTGTMTSKAEQKRHMNRPRANSGRYTPPPPPPARTASDYVADLRKNRGQGA